MNQDFQKIIIVIATFLVICYTFFFGIQKRMHHTMPVNTFHTGSLAVAISESKYGTNEYDGYVKVFDTLRNNGIYPFGVNDSLKRLPNSLEENLPNHEMINEAISKSVNLKNVGSDGIFNVQKESQGMIKYFKLAMDIFGYRVESFYFLYYLLMSISLVLFLLTFYKRQDLLLLLFIYSICHYLSVTVVPFVGIELQTVCNSRFLPVLSIIPTLYIALLILYNYKMSLLTLLAAFYQSFLIYFVVWARSSAQYQILFIFFIYFSILFWNLIKNRELRKYIFVKVRSWAILLFLIGFISLKLHSILILDYRFDISNSTHMFWYAAIMGLGIHPDAKEKHGIVPEDYGPWDIVYRVDPEYKYIEPGKPYNILLAEQILKKEFFRILKSDPKYVLENYAIKIPMFFNVYFGEESKEPREKGFRENKYFPYLPENMQPSIGLRKHLLSPLLLLVIVLIGMLTSLDMHQSFIKNLFIIITGWIFSMLPMMFWQPNPIHITDSALFFSMIIYMMLFFSIYLVKNAVLVIFNKVKK